MNTTLKKITEQIYQEQWTRASLDTFSTNNFETIDVSIHSLSKEDKNTALDICKEQLEKNKKSVYALYIAGIIELEIESINDIHIFQLINIFSEEKKWNVVEYLCQKILEIHINLSALRTLDIVYQETEQFQKQVEIWEKIIQEDFEETDALHKLALYKIKQQNFTDAKIDLQKALNRYIHHNQKNDSEIKKLWNLLLDVEIENNIEHINFFLNYCTNIETALGKEKAEELYAIMRDKLPTDYNIDVRINILKNLLRLNNENFIYREQLVEAYRKKYQDNEKLEEFIRMTNLTQQWRNVQEAINDFEKHISFFPGSFVYHNKWGIGRIKETTHLSLIIDFAKKRNHTMDITMAVLSLEVLPKNHFWVIRSVLSYEKLHEKVLQSPQWALKCILKSLGSADMKTIKTELVPDILSVQEWSTWNIKAKKILNTNQHFGILSTKIDHFIFSDITVSSIEKYHKLMQLEDRFVGKIKLFRKAFETIKNSKEKSDIEFFWLMFDYFYSYIQNPNNSYDSNYIYALFLCEESSQAIQFSTRNVSLPMEKVFTVLEFNDLKQMLQEIKITDYKLLLFHKLKQYKENWEELYLNLFPYFPNETLLNELCQNYQKELLNKIYLKIYNNALEFKDAFIWFTISLKEKDWIQSLSKDIKVYSNLLRIAINLLRDIANKKEVPVNKRNLNLIQTFLFKKENFPKAFENFTEQEITYMYSLLSQLNDVIPNRVLQIREQILVRFPNFEFNDKFAYDESTSSGFLTTEKQYKEKQRELIKIQEVDVPTNSKEIEKARSFGDLRENAEYKAALEHQSNLNNKIHQLTQELEQARVFNLDNANNSKVSFGTKVLLEEHQENGKSTKNEFIILGPWESNPEKGIISYLSPFGQKLYQHKKDEVCEFSINNTKRMIKILDIQKIDNYL